MVVAGPFRGLRYNPAVVGDPGLVIAPPYDAISPAAWARLRAASPYNIARLTFGLDHRDAAASKRAAGLLRAWRGDGALFLDQRPALYLYEQSHAVAGGKRCVQRGVMASVRMDPSGRWVIPHERTLPGPVAARRRLLEATRANLSPILGVYAGGGDALATLAGVAASRPLAAVSDIDGVHHRLWAVTDEQQIGAWCQAIAPERILIADGHHRYRAALDSRARLRRGGMPAGAPWDETLMLLVDIDVYGPRLRAIHRLLPAPLTVGTVRAALAATFEADRVSSLADAEAALADLPPSVLAYGLYGDGDAWVLRARDAEALRAEVGVSRRPLDVEVLHGPVFARLLGTGAAAVEVRFEGDLASATKAVASGVAASLIMLRPPDFQDVLETAGLGETLPPKATLFRPKPWDGLVMRTLDDQVRSRGAAGGPALMPARTRTRARTACADGSQHKHDSDRP